jgi:hypothetical protein
MIFKQELVERILAGDKTVTRRVADGPCRYRVGADNSVQPGRGQREVARILFTEIRLCALGRLSGAEARREGFANPDDFRRTWEVIHGHYDPELPVYRIAFKLVNGNA